MSKKTNPPAVLPVKDKAAIPANTPKRKLQVLTPPNGLPKIKVTGPGAAVLLLISALWLLPTGLQAASPGIIPVNGSVGPYYTNKLLVTLNGSGTTNELVLTNATGVFGNTNATFIRYISNKWEWHTNWTALLATNVFNRPTGDWKTVASGALYGSSRYTPRSVSTIPSSTPTNTATNIVVKVDTSTGALITPTNFFAANSNALNAAVAADGSDMGLTVNARIAGLRGDGAAENHAIVTALARTNRPVFFPAGTYLITNSVIFTNVTATWTGDNQASVITSTVPNTSWLFDLRNSPRAKITGFTFDLGQAMSTAVTTGGAIFLNPVDGSLVERNTFRNIDGIGVLVLGDSDIYNRSNRWSVSRNWFARCANAIHAAQTNRSEFGSIAHNQAWDFRGTFIFCGSANIEVIGNMCSGYLGLTDTYNTEVGIWIEPSLTGSDPGRCHSLIEFNHIGHCGEDLRARNCTGGGLNIANNTFGGGGYSVVSNCVNTRVINNLFNPYAALWLTNNIALTFSDNQVSGTFGATNGTYVGSGNYDGSGTPLTSDTAYAGRYFIRNGGSLDLEGTDVLRINKWSGGYGSLITDKFWAKTTFWLDNAGSINYDSADTFKLNAWSSGSKLASLRVLSLMATNIVHYRTNNYTTSELTTSGQFGYWNSNAIGIIYRSVNSNGTIVVTPQ